MLKEKFAPIKEKNSHLLDLCQYLHDKIVWENQEGQPDHFDRLPKVEQVALIDMLNKIQAASAAIENFDRWFMQQ